MKSLDPQVKFKRMSAFGETDGTTIWIDPRKYKGVEALDTYLHEKEHIKDMRAGERAIIKRTQKQVNSYLSII